jgi:hypothetical protein
MKKLALSLMACSLLATTARADISIPIPSPTTAVTVTDTSAMGIKNLCGASFYKGKSTSNVVSLTETTAGELELSWNLTYATADGPYGTAVGLLLPIDAAWDIKDLSAASEIDYDVKAASATPANSVQMMIGSNNYGDSAAAANAALAQPKWTALTAAYQTVKVMTADMAMNSWYTGSDAAITGWYDPTVYTYNMGKTVKNLNFQPQIGWTSSTVIKSGATGTFFIRNVKIIGVADYTFTQGTCTGTGLNIEDFLSTKPDITQNYLGGYWYAFSDTSANPPKNDSAIGSSKIILPVGDTGWVPSSTYGALMTATLEKDVTTSSYLYHPYAGWADVGMGVKNPNLGDSVLNLQPGAAGGALTAISFDLFAGPALGGTYTIDTTLIRRIIFKVSKASVPDAEPFSVDIPVGMASNLTANNFCVDATALQQPGWYVTNNLGGTPVAFSANDLTKLAWEIKIEDQKDPTKHTSANNTIAVNNVKFYGVTGADGVKAKAGTVAGLKASYGSQLVLSYNVAGTTAQIDVVRLDGSKVASIKASAVANHLALPVSLARGTYLVSVRGNNSRLVSSVTSY